MKSEDFLLSKDAIKRKYPQGSPDYPTHAERCECSDCYASWIEWRSGHEGAKAMRAYIVREMRKSMRMAIEDHTSQEDRLWGWAKDVLASDAGAKLLARVQALEAVAEAAREVTPISPEEGRDLHAALNALDKVSTYGHVRTRIRSAWSCAACRDRRGYVVNPGAHWVPCKHRRKDGELPGDRGAVDKVPR